MIDRVLAVWQMYFRQRFHRQGGLDGTKRKRDKRFKAVLAEIIKKKV